MKARVCVALVGVLVLMLPALGASAAKPEAKEKPAKMTVCHVPPGNPGNEHTIQISERAWKAHDAHGDYEGECDGRSVPDEPDEPDDGNRRPVADAGPDQCVLFDNEVDLDGTDSSDPDGDSLTFDWNVTDNPSQSTLDDGDLSPNDNDDDPSFTPDQFGLYTFELEVEDPDGLKDTDSVDVEVYMTVELNRTAYTVGEGETTPVVISLNEPAPRDLFVDIDINDEKAIVVGSTGSTTALSQVEIEEDESSVRVYLRGVEDDRDTDDESTTLTVSMPQFDCIDVEDSAAVTVEDDDEVLSSSLPSDVQPFVVRLLGRLII